jgi:hypothetical protein
MTVIELKELCIEYLREFCSKKCWREGGDRSVDWYNSIIREVFNPMDDDFWKWLGEDIHLLSMAETSFVLSYIRDYHESIGLSVSSRVYGTSTNAHIVSMYGNAIVHSEMSIAWDCITETYIKLDRTADINAFNDVLIHSMSVDPEFNQWVGVSASLGLAETCIDEGITFEKVKYDFDKR